MKLYKFYFGKKFSQNKNGYWVCTTHKGLYAQRWVWMNHHFEDPEDMHIHHCDLDKSNNDPSNLLKVTPSEHIKIHWRMRKYDPNQLLLAI